MEIAPKLLPEKKKALATCCVVGPDTSKCERDIKRSPHHPASAQRRVEIGDRCHADDTRTVVAGLAQVDGDHLDHGKGRGREGGGGGRRIGRKTKSERGRC